MAKHLSSFSRGTNPPWVVALVALALAGAAVRFVHLDRKFWYHDEATTSLRVSGFQIGDVTDGIVGRVVEPDSFLRFQRVNSEHGVVDTARSLAYNDPQHPPLFFVAARVWAGVFGSSISSLRALAALFGVGCVLAMYWLGRELFDDRLTPLALAALTAISPFEFLYSQVAREYSLWAALVAASSAAFLRALRIASPLNWALYALLVALALLTYPLTVLVVGSHLLFVLAAFGRAGIRYFRQIVLSLAAAALVFAPWVYVMVKHRDAFSGGTNWTRDAIPFSESLRRWVVEVGLPFVDNPALVRPLSLATGALAALALALAAVAFGAFWSRGDRRAALFATALALSSAPLLAADLAFGGTRSVVPRFIVPTLLAIEIPVAFLLSTLLRSNRRVALGAGAATLGCITIAAVLSYARSVDAPVWWTHDDGAAADNVAAVRLLDRTRSPHLVSTGVANPLEMSHYLKPQTRIAVVYEGRLAQRLEPGTLVYGSAADGDAQERLSRLLGSIRHKQPGTLRQLLPQRPCCDARIARRHDQLWRIAP